MSFGPRLRALRVRAGWSQAELARRAGILAHSVYRYESNRNQPGFPIAKKLADALSVSVEELFDGKQKARKAS